MIRRAWLAASLILGFAPGLEASDLRVWIDADFTAYLENTTALPLSFNAYSLGSQTSLLDPAGWKSIASQVSANPIEIMNQLGPGALTFGAVSPSPINLSELTLHQPGATLQPRAKFLIGKPFAGGNWWTDATGSYLPAGSTTPLPMQVGMPEPSTWLLGMLAALGLLARLRAGRDLLGRESR